MRVLVIARDQMTGERTRTINALIALVRTIDLGIDARKPLTARQISTIAGWRDRDEHASTATCRREAARLARRVRTPLRATGHQLREGRSAVSDEPAPASPTGSRVPLTGEGGEYVWREAERIVREAADTISAQAGTNPDAAADAAWAAADILSAAAAGLEGDAGGPLTDAAAAFDRAGRDVNRRIPPRTDTGTALRSAGRMIALLGPGTNHAGRACRSRHCGAGGPGKRHGGPAPVPAAAAPGRGRVRLGRPIAPCDAATVPQRRRPCCHVLRPQARQGPAVQDRHDQQEARR